MTLTSTQIAVRKQIQQRLKDLSAQLGVPGLDPGDVDGVYGVRTQLALTKFQQISKLTLTGQPDPATMAALFPQPPKGLNIVEATIVDYVLNFLGSKINWAAMTLVAVVVGWVSTKFGINVPPDLQNTVTGWLVTGGGALIVILRTFFNKPKIVAGKVVTPPAA